MGRKQPLHMETVDPRVLMGQVGALLKRVLPASMRVEYRRGGAHPAVLGDAAQLNQVFMNLCLNARDAMPQGGTLTLGAEELVVDAANVAAHPWAQPGRYVVCTVTDTGVGMTPEIQRRMFEPFFSTKGELGTGLGLAVAYGIVRQHGGMLTCTSEPGVGSTFSVCLPARVVTAEERAMGTQDAMPRGNERVLVADDEPLVRSAVTRLLEQAGYSVVAVESGVAACAAARLQAFDLVLLDAVMPGMNGRQAHDHLRVLLPRARFLFTSGHAADALPPDFLQGLDVAVLTKPYNPPELWRAVRKALP
jgi:CheY-like chemotaxis protein